MVNRVMLVILYTERNNKIFFGGLNVTLVEGNASVYQVYIWRTF